MGCVYGRPVLVVRVACRAQIMVRAPAPLRECLSVCWVRACVRACVRDPTIRPRATTDAMMVTTCPSPTARAPDFRRGKKWEEGSEQGRRKVDEDGRTGHMDRWVVG